MNKDKPSSRDTRRCVGGTVGKEERLRLPKFLYSELKQLILSDAEKMKQKQNSLFTFLTFVSYKHSNTTQVYVYASTCIVTF